MAELTLDQVSVFLAVVDRGGFAAAARTLGRAQSAVTYSIRSLEDATGLLLFDRRTYRPTLTDAGRALLPRARQLVADADDMRRQADAFAQGVEAMIGLVVEPMVPLGPVSHALRRLRAAFPSVLVRLHAHHALPGAPTLPPTGNWIGLLPVLPGRAFGPDYTTVHWSEVELVAVAAPEHPLAHLPSPLAAEAVRGHMQVVWTPPSAAADSADMGVHALDRWYTTDWSAKRELIRAGIGWGSLPAHFATDGIQRGDLVKLDMQSWDGSEQMPRFPISIVRRVDRFLQPATLALIEALKACAPHPQAETGPSRRSSTRVNV